MSVTRENALLFAACGGLEPDVSDGIDWAYTVRAAGEQGVLPLLHDWLAGHPATPCPADVSERLHEAYWQCHFQNRQLLHELMVIAGAAAARGIRIMPTKGARLALGYYPRPALRPLSDLDLLVPAGRLAAMGELLAGMGYAEVDDAPAYANADRLDPEGRDYCWFRSHRGFDALVEYRAGALELAVGRLTDLDKVFSARLRAHDAAVWARATPGEDGHGDEQSPEDLLLHVTTHLAAKHVDFRLIWLYDIACLVRSRALDWEYIAATTAALRVSGAVAASLRAAAQWLRAPVPATALAAVERGINGRTSLAFERRDHARLIRLASSLGERDLSTGGPAAWSLGAALSRASGWRARVRMLRWVAWPGREYLAHRGVTADGPFGAVTGGARLYAGRLSRALRAVTRRGSPAE